MKPLAQQAQPTAAKGSANRHLPAPRRGTCHEQIRHVQAGDEQHATGGREQHVKRLLEVAHHVLEERAAAGALMDKWIVGVCIVQALRDDGEIGGGLFRVHSRLQSTNGEEGVVVEHGHEGCGGVMVERSPQFGACIGKGEPCGHDADDGVRFGVDVDGSIDDGGVGGKAALPEVPTKQHAPLAAGLSSPRKAAT